MVLHGLFPDAGDITHAQFWTGLRPMTPDGTPILGQASAKFPNVWLNTGPGTLGWTMACGSGRVLADLMAHDKPAIDIQDLQFSRYL